MPSFGTLKADTLTHSTAGSLATNFVVNGVAKHWVKFEGDGTVAVSDSLNNSSITDNATGKYNFAFTSNFNTGDYCFAGGGTVDVGSYNVYMLIEHDNGGTPTSTIFTASMSPSSGGTLVDGELLSFTNTGDLA